jgi:hypothetical protein
MKKDISGVLRAFDATQDELASSARHWANVIAAETRRDEFALQEGYDDAYVAALEKARGRVIDADEYARISIGMERGDALPALSALGLPRDALFPIERVFMRRTMRDSALDAEIDKALARARRSMT